MTPATVIAHDSIEQSIKEWALDYGITSGIIIARLQRGMSVAAAITKPMMLGHPSQRLACPDMERFIKKSNRRFGGPPGKRYTHDGIALTIPQWAARGGLAVEVIRQRIAKGWDVGKAVSTPPDRRTRKRDDRGVVSDFEPSKGTGGGSVAREIPEIDFSEMSENA